MDGTNVHRVLGGLAERLGGGGIDDYQGPIGCKLEELGGDSHALPVTRTEVFVMNDSHRVENVDESDPGASGFCMLETNRKRSFYTPETPPI